MSRQAVMDQEKAWHDMSEPIAIVGIGCRYPGGIDSPAKFWQLLCDGVDAISDMPPGRFDTAAYYSPVPGAPGKIATRQGGFVDQIDSFDSAFFDISPREATAMDPQQRLLLETAWEALEDAGIPRERLAGSRTGVFVGMWTNDYADYMYDRTREIDLYMTTGGGRYSASGRLSYTFDLQGPSVTIDTACSSSLVALHLACQSLRSGESTMALAGAANLIIQPEISIGYSRSGMLSPDGRCKFGDVRANGYVRSEGVAVVVLKPLKQALADGDPIYALIRGSATNNDGYSSGLLVAPSGQGQTMMLREAYRQAGVLPGHVDYLEAHGTGTPAGDPVELKALGAVLAEGRIPGQSCLIGSVKTNIGHTEAASGMAGLIKAVLALTHRTIPASLHFETPNPKIPWSDLPLTIVRKLTPWPDHGRPAIAGVNSFGVTGTNAHIVLQEAPSLSRRDRSDAKSRPLALPISARTIAAQKALAQRYSDTLAQIDSADVQDLCYSAAVRRSHHEQRLAIVADSREGFAEGLEACLRGEQHPQVCEGQVTAEPPKVAFVFPGQGSQWFGMARELLAHEPAFRAALENCDRAIFAETGWSTIEQLEAAESDSRLGEIDVIQPTLFAIQVALAALWQSWGIVPAAVVGHSMGEIAAAHVAGALSLEDAVAIICRRSRLLRRVRGQGAMAVVDLSLAEARATIIGHEDRLAIAVSNSPRSTVISGDPAALSVVIAQLEQREVFCRPVKVDVASHSPQMDPLLDELRAALASLAPRQSAAPIYSTVAGAIVDGSTLDADYWAHNLRQPVLFATAAQLLGVNGHTAFIEISPHPILLPAIEQVLQQVGQQGLALASLRRAEPERVTMLTTLAALYTIGAPVDWSALFPAGGQHVYLPSYPWQRERFWYEHASAVAGSPRGGHPLLGYALRPASRPGSIYWETSFAVAQQSFLADHQVQGAAFFPATGFVEMALAAAEQAGGSPCVIEELSLHEALILPEAGERAIQLVLDQDFPGVLQLRVYSAAESRDEWQLHAEGRLRLNADAAAPAHDAPAVIKSRCTKELPGGAHYQVMQGRALAYGPAFQVIERCWQGEGETLGQLALPVEARQSSAAHIVLLDGCLQLAVATLPEATVGQTFLPVSIERVQVFGWPEHDGELWAHVVLTEHATGWYSYDVVMLDGAGQVLAELRGVRLQRVGGAALSKIDELLYALRWEVSELPASSEMPATPGSWLLFAGTDVERDLTTWLTSQGERVIVVTQGDTYRQIKPDRYELDPIDDGAYIALLRDVCGPEYPSCRGVIYAWSTNISADNAVALKTAEELGCASVVALVRALGETGWPEMPRLWLLTRGAQMVSEAPGPVAAAQALAWGLGRVVAVEHPELRCTLIDLSPAGAQGEGQQLVDEIWSGVAALTASQVALRGAERCVARLARLKAPVAAEAPATTTTEVYRLVAATPGSLESLRPRAMGRTTPGPNEIEVRIEAAGLNFLDVLKALGIYPGFEPSPEVTLGAECAGTVVAVGAGVSEFAPGDSVVVLTPSYIRTSLISAFTTVPAAFAVHRPAQLSAEQASGLPVVLLTAYYALHELGRLRRGERVLIHSAAGGVGLAAIELCRRAGAEIFATAGSPEKRDYLRSLGIEHVFDSRSLDFAGQILAQTGGCGVDIVLNSLTGEAIQCSLAALASRGRFLEIGKRDIYDNSRIGLEPFKKNLSYFAIDLARLTEEEPEYVAGLFREVMALVAAGELAPLPVQTFPLEEAAEAFRTMAQARHIGKVVLSIPEQPLAAEALLNSPIRSDATYLVSGGLGGLGLEVARWLVQRGARHLALLGRSAPSAPALAALADLESAGARVITLAADVADAAQLGQAIETIAQTMPPLRGVIHAAGVLADATVAELDRERLHRALAPKVMGGWNLHILTRELPLDFFVLFSSASALLGLAGQANYAAANAFLDGLAGQRRTEGLPALSINWGPWAAIGLAAAQDNRGARLANHGLGSLTPAEGIDALDLLLSTDATQACVMRLDANRWAAYEPGASALLVLLCSDAEDTTPSAAPQRQSLRETLLAVEPGRRRRTLLEDAVCAQLAQVLRIAPEKIDRQRPLKATGLDSLMALELRSRLEAETGLTLSATIAWNYPTIAIMAEFLAGRMDLALEAQAHTTEVAASPGLAELAAEGEELTQDELESLLSDELAAVDRLLNAE